MLAASSTRDAHDFVELLLEYLLFRKHLKLIPDFLVLRILPHLLCNVLYQIVFEQLLLLLNLLELINERHLGVYVFTLLSQILILHLPSTP